MNLPFQALQFLRAVVALAGLALTGAALVLASGTVSASGGHVILLAELVVLASVAQHFPLAFGPKRKFDLSIAVHYAMVLVAPAPLAVLAAAIGEGMGQGTLMLRRNPETGRRRRGLHGALFNTAQFTLSVAVAGAVYLAVSAVPGPFDGIAALCAAGALYATNVTLVAAMAALHQEKGWRGLGSVWLEGRGWSATQSAGLMVLGYVMAQASRHEPWVPLLMAVPAALTYASLNRTAQAQAEIRARDEFLSLASHELRTPLTSLRGYAQLLRERFRAMDPGALAMASGIEYAPRALETIDRQSARLCTLIDQLLDVSRLQSGKLVLETETLDLAELVRDVSASLQLIIPDYRLEVKAPGAVYAAVDRMRIEQVLTNLITNAARYANGGDRIEVEVSSADGKAMLSVRDYGVGIPAQHRTRIFDRYYQVESGRPSGGLGVGLYITHQIVERHGGRIALEAPTDAGARFVITLPLAAAPLPEMLPTPVGGVPLSVPMPERGMQAAFATHPAA